MEETVSSSSDDDEAGSSGSKMPVLPPLPPVVSAGYSLLVARAPVSQQRVESTAERLNNRLSRIEKLLQPFIQKQEDSVSLTAVSKDGGPKLSPRIPSPKPTPRKPPPPPPRVASVTPRRGEAA